MKTGRTAAATDRGRKRLRNEDAYVCDPPLFAVADGMGGAQAGEIASGLAAAALGERSAGERGEETVAALVHEANARIYRRAVEDPNASGMGTTATVALLDEDDGTMAIGHVGDSRSYRFRDGALDQLTVDHSLVAELIRSGQLTEEEASVHPHRAVITRALGTEPNVEVDTLTVELRSGDVYLICSDGLTTMVDNDDVLNALEHAGRDPEQVARLLVAAANEAGGEDNVTVVVFEIVDGQPAPRSVEPETLDPEPADPAEPEEAVAIEETAEDAAPNPVEPATESAIGQAFRRHGAGHGSRLMALALIVAAVTIAALVLYVGLLR